MSSYGWLSRTQNSVFTILFTLCALIQVEESQLQEDMKRIRRGEKSGWAFFIIGIVLIGFGYAFYDTGVRYSGLMLMIMGIVSIVFGFVLVHYSRQISGML